MRRLWLLLLLVVLAGGGFWTTWWFLRSPQYALYQIGKAIHDREPRRFFAYVDLGGILRQQKDELVRMFLPERSAEFQNQVGRILAAFMDPVSAEVKRRVARLIADPKRDNLPSAWALVWAARVERNGDYALVVLSDPRAGRRLRLAMQRRPQVGHWQVVELDPRDLRRLLAEYLRQRAEDR